MGMPRRLRLGLALCCIGISGAFLLAWPSHAEPHVPCADPEIHVFKAEGELALHCRGQLRLAMPATFGAHPSGPKEREGDERTPEGEYRVTSKIIDPRFHRFLGISYPNEHDRARARKQGVRRLGGGIGIHGARTGLAPIARAWTRWTAAMGLAGVWGPTDGCIGVANEHAESLYTLVPVGTRVLIAPRRPPS
jgi:murein L,D-transpeptidase YafK